MSIFDGSEKEIGRGAQAIVYRYKGFAYKVYNDNYPKEYIKGEYLIQDEINQMDLSVVKYYKTEKENVIKMDLIDGVTLAERMKCENYAHGIEDMIQLQKQILQKINHNLPTLKSYALKDLNHMTIDEEKKKKAIEIMDCIPETDNLLHLDFHLLNIMYAKGVYYIIDWINARIGNPVYDYARSYIILNEIAEGLAQQYLALLEQDKEIDLTYFNQAVYVMALLRTKEHKSVRTEELIQNMENTID